MSLFTVCNIIDANIAQPIQMVVRSHFSILYIIGKQITIHQRIDNASTGNALCRVIVAQVQTPSAQLLGISSTKHGG